MSLAASPPALQDAILISTSTWQGHLESLFRFAMDRFPDVVWEVKDGQQEVIEEVWGHKGISDSSQVCQHRITLCSYRIRQSTSELSSSIFRHTAFTQ